MLSIEEILNLSSEGIEFKMKHIRSPNRSFFSKSNPQDVISTPVKTTSLMPFKTNVSICFFISDFVIDLEFPLAYGIMQKVHL